MTSCFKNVQPSFNTCMHLFDHLVVPILTYGADICGYRHSRSISFYNELKNNIFEKCHLKYLRYVLGVNKKAPNLAIYGDSGRFPIYLSTISMFIKYWHRLVNVKNDILQDAYKLHEMNHSEWYNDVTTLFKRVELSIHEASKLKCKHIVSRIVESCKICFKTNWYNELFDDKRKGNSKNKLRNYRVYKNIFHREEYLVQQNVINRKNTSRLRMSCHKLEIEAGRYSSKNKIRINSEDRICRNCNIDEIEDECHFICVCSKYQNERDKLFNYMEEYCLDFKDLNGFKKYVAVMSCQDKKIIKTLGEYISKCFNIRSGGSDLNSI